MTGTLATSNWNLNPCRFFLEKHEIQTLSQHKKNLFQDFKSKYLDLPTWKYWGTKNIRITVGSPIVFLIVRGGTLWFLVGMCASSNPGNLSLIWPTVTFLNTTVTIQICFGNLGTAQALFDLWRRPFSNKAVEAFAISYGYFIYALPSELAFHHDFPKWDQNLQFPPLSEMTSIPVTFIWEPPRETYS